jgi:ribosomal protein S2
LDIPISAIIDVNTKSIDNINYPILSNNKSFETNLLLLETIKIAKIKAQQKELSKILRIT